MTRKNRQESADASRAHFIAVCAELQALWGYDFETGSKSLDVYIGYLRRKLETDGAPRLIHTVRGVGYVARAG